MSNKTNGKCFFLLLFFKKLFKKKKLSLNKIWTNLYLCPCAQNQWHFEPSHSVCTSTNNKALGGTHTVLISFSFSAFQVTLLRHIIINNMSAMQHWCCVLTGLVSHATGFQSKQLQLCCAAVSRSITNSPHAQHMTDDFKATAHSYHIE